MADRSGNGGALTVIEAPDHAAHSALGASGAHRWLACPGSFRLSRTVPPRRSSSYAAAGTLAHTLIEAAIFHGPQALEQMRDSTVTVEGHEIAVDEDFLAGIEVMLDYVGERVRQTRGKVKVEHTIYLDDYFANTSRPPPVRLFGRVDVALLDTGAAPLTLEIIDYKNGSGVLVDPADNPQMLYYAAGVIAELNREGVHPGKVRLTVVQPHARSPDKIRHSDLDLLDLLMWVDEILVPGVHACGEPDAPLKPGSWCRFCPASFACPALHAKAVEMAKRDFKDHVLPETPADLAEALNTAALAQAWIDAVRAYAIEQLQKQVRIPGWSLGPTRPVRRWRDAAAIERIVMVLGLGREAHRSDVLTPAQMEKLVRRKGIDWDRQFAPLVDSVSSGVKLVRTDTRDPSEDFEEDPT